jgi:hypothetical protein
MLTRRYGVALGIAVAMTVLAAMTAQSAPAADAGREAGRTAKQPMLTWVKLDLRGGLPPLRESLTVATDGRASVRMGSTRHNGYAGTFEYKIPPKMLARLKQAVREANLRAMPDEYPPPARAVDYTIARLKVRDELGVKRVQVTSASRRYPRALKSLVDLTAIGRGSRNQLVAPAGLLSEIILEATRRPLAAIGVRTELHGRPFRVGKGISVDVVIRNVGRQPVVLPSLDCKEIADCLVWVKLWTGPSHPDQSFTPMDYTLIEFGPRSHEYDWTINDRVRADLSHVVRLGPGEEWRISMPKALMARSPGDYEVVADFRVLNLYDRAALERELGETFVDCWIDVRPVQLTVRE